MKRLSSLLALMLACGGAEPAAPAAAAAKPGAAEKPAAADDVKDRSQTPLKTIKETIDGVGFSIDAPEGLKRETNDKDKWINWTFTDGNPFEDPSITVKLGDPVMSPKDLEAFARRATGMSQDKPPLVVAKKEELPGGGGMLVLAERSDGQYFKLAVIHRKDDKIVECTVTHRTGTGRPDDRPIANFAATKTWAEKLCSSVTID